MNKRGFQITLDFVIDLIIGVLCALIIIYLGTLLYSMFFSGKEKDMAMQTLISLEEKTKELGGSSPRIALEVPRGWYLVSFEKGVNSDKKDILPQMFCADSNCACVCKPTKLLGIIQTSVDCRKIAACRIFIQPFKQNGKDVYIKIENTMVEIADYGGFFNLNIIKDENAKK